MQKTTDRPSTTTTEIAGEIRDFLTGRSHGATSTELQLGIRRRRAAVIATVNAMVAAGSLRADTSRHEGRDRTVYHLTTKRITTGADKQSGCARVLERLRRGPATHHELYALNVIVHSRIANLRDRGFNIPKPTVTIASDGSRTYTYTLIEPAISEAAA